MPITLLEDRDWTFAIINALVPSWTNAKIVENSPVVYLLLFLSKLLTKATPGILSHEIVHSQINSHKGATNFYNNLEVISIFVQLVENYEKDEHLLELEKTERLLSISYVIEC